MMPLAMVKQQSLATVLATVKQKSLAAVSMLRTMSFTYVSNLYLLWLALAMTMVLPYRCDVSAVSLEQF
jgi:hypothetical protein